MSDPATTSMSLPEALRLVIASIRIGLGGNAIAILESLIEQAEKQPILCARQPTVPERARERRPIMAGDRVKAPRFCEYGMAWLTGTVIQVDDEAGCIDIKADPEFSLVERFSAWPRDVEHIEP